MQKTIYLGWSIERNPSYSKETYEAFTNRTYRTAWLFAATLKEIKAKIDRHIERWGW